MPTVSSDWPAAEPALGEGERFLRERTGGRTVLVPDGDVDGLTAAGGAPLVDPASEPSGTNV